MANMNWTICVWQSCCNCISFWSIHRIVLISFKTDFEVQKYKNGVLKTIEN
jgi:hypothetical protein